MKLCDLETAKALQELGYDGEYQYFHVNACEEGYETITTAQCKVYESDIDNQCPAPRLDDAAYWIREKYCILIFVRYEEDQDSGTFFDVYSTDMSNEHTRYLNSFSDYDDALEYGVKRAIEIIKDRQNDEQEIR